MFLPRTAWTVLLSLSLTVGLPGVSLAETVLDWDVGASAMASGRTTGIGGIWDSEGGNDEKIGMAAGIGSAGCAG